ncbi:MAG: hypothetical protein AB7T06_09565 [Kofleriaceae bacterium]
MAKWNTEWKVGPHGPIEKLSERLWRVEADVPGIPMKRVMTIAKRANGELVVHNAVAISDKEMAEIEAWGPIKTLVVPSGYHRLDAKVFHDRYPSAQILCPDGATKAVSQAVPVTGSFAQLPPDGAVELANLDGTKDREGVMIVRDGDGTSLVLNDAVFNMPHLRGFTGFVLKSITASTGGPKVSRVMKWFVVADKKAFRSHLERLADIPDLRRIVVSHHEVIDRDAGATLRDVASKV